MTEVTKEGFGPREDFEEELRRHYEDAEVGSAKTMALYDFSLAVQAARSYYSSGKHYYDLKRSGGLMLDVAESAHLRNIAISANVESLINSRISSVPGYAIEKNYIEDQCNRLSKLYVHELGGWKFEEEAHEKAEDFLHTIMQYIIYRK